MNSVYITREIPEIASSLLRRKGFQVSTNSQKSNLKGSELKEIFAKYDAVITMMTDRIDGEIIGSASDKLKIIANYAVGFDNIDVLAAKRHGIVVTNTPAVAGESVAEHTFALILACSKKLIESDRFVRLGKFHQWDPSAFLSKQIWGQTIGIVGLGRIGTYVGQIAFYGFRMKILYHDIQTAEDFEMLTEAKRVSLTNLLKQSDIVTLHVPLMPQTHHLIGKNELKLMKNSAILINTSRGPVIDEEALIWALHSNEIGAAGLDVYEKEPHVPPEFKVSSKVVLTPHTASATFETRDAMARIAAENIIDFFDGKTPQGLIKVS